MVFTLKYQGDTFVDAINKANVFADYFSSVFTSEDVTHVHIPTLTTDPNPTMSVTNCLCTLLKFGC